MNQKKLLAIPIAAGIFLPVIAYAQDQSGDPITPYADIRYRLEIVDQDGVAEDATASTLRVKAGLETKEWHGFSALVEGEAIVRLGPQDYNETVHGRTAFPVVADPSDVLLNQAYVKYRPIKELQANACSQVINIENQLRIV